MLSRHSFNFTSMPFLFIIIHANQKNLTVVILQAIQIVFLLNLLYCLFCGMSPFQFHNHGWQVAVSIRFKYNVCETLSSWHFSMQGVVFLSRVVCKRNHTGQSIFIVVFQDGCVRLMCLFNQLCNCLFVAGKCGLQHFQRFPKLLQHFPTPSLLQY